MRITKIIVTKLFGIFNHEIPLKTEDRITIIHGLNGIGKTNLLRLINGFFNFKYSELRSIPFDEFRIYFDNLQYLLIKIEDTKRKKSIKFSLLDETDKPIHKPYEYNGERINGKRIPLSMIASRIDDHIPALKRVDPQTWLYLPDGEILTLEDIIERFSEYLPPSLRSFNNDQPEWLNNIRESINVRFIESQRLLNVDNDNDPRDIRHRSSQNSLPSVLTYSKELSKVIQEKLAEYGKLSQSLDRTFPARVVQQTSEIALTDEQLQNKLNELEDQRKRLIDAGLLKQDEDSNFQVPDHIDESIRKLLSVYVEDVEQKLNIFSDILHKIELFQKNINRKFSYKSLSISQDKGFIFTTENGHTLSPTDLSSGEQHELILLYELLFKVKPNSLILIDEPELSLHMGWKMKFIDDLQEITQLSKIDILMATHSSSLINGRWDLTVQLKG